MEAGNYIEGICSKGHSTCIEAEVSYPPRWPLTLVTITQGIPANVNRMFEKKRAATSLVNMPINSVNQFHEVKSCNSDQESNFWPPFQYQLKVNVAALQMNVKNEGKHKD